jgi:hypothetical protein
VDWSPCSEGSIGAKPGTAAEFACARAQVPLDYSDPGRRTIELALVKRAATDPGRRIGTLFFNPGGPGEAERRNCCSFTRPGSSRVRYGSDSTSSAGILAG